MLFAERAPPTRSTPQGARISYVFEKGYKGWTHTTQRSRGSLHCASYRGEGCCFIGGERAPQSGGNACTAGCIWS